MAVVLNKFFGEGVTPDATNYMGEDSGADTELTAAPSPRTLEAKRQGLLLAGADGEAVAADPLDPGLNSQMNEETTPLPTFDIISEKLGEEATLEEIQASATRNDEVRQTLADMNVRGEFNAITAEMANDPNVAAISVRIQSRLDSAASKMVDLSALYSEGGTDTITEFIDSLVHYTGQDYTQAAGYLVGDTQGAATELSLEWLKAARTLDDDAWNAFVRDRITTASAGTFFHGERSSFLVEEELQAIQGVGYIMGDDFWTAVSTALVVGEVFEAGKLLVKSGRSVLGNVRSVVGTDRATELAAKREVSIATDVGEDAARYSDDVVADTTPTPPQASLDEAGILDDTLPTGAANTHGGAPTPPPINQGVMSRVMAENAFVQEFIRRGKLFAFGAPDMNLDTWAKREAANLSTTVARPNVTWNIVEEGATNSRLDMVFGKANGDTYKSFSAAKRVADKTESSIIIDTNTGKVVTGGVNSGGSYAIQVSKRLPNSNLDALDLAEVSASHLKNIFLHSSTISPQELSNLANSAEFGGKAFTKHFRGVTKLWKSLSKSEVRGIDDIILALRDDPRMSGNRQWYDLNEFAKLYEVATGKPATNKVLKAYEAFQQASDFSWFIDASKRLSDIANADGLALDLPNGAVALVFKTEDLASLPPTTLIADFATGKSVLASSLSPDTPLRRISGGNLNGAEFVVGWERDARLPTHTDVMPYNAGGHRSNPDIKYFAGSTKDGSWSTLFGALTNKNAQDGVTQFNTVSKALRETLKGRHISSLTKAERSKLDELVRANNDWNPDLETIDDFFKNANNRGVDLDNDIVFRERDHRTTLADVQGDPSMAGKPLHQYSKYSRQDATLFQYGGANLVNESPILSIVRRLNTSVKKGTLTAYERKSTSGFVKTLSALISKDVKDVSGTAQAALDVVGWERGMSDAQIVRNVTINGNSPAAKKLRNEQTVIKRRMGWVGPSALTTATKAGAMVNSVVEAILNRKYLNSVDSVIAQKFNTAVKASREFSIDEASGKLLALGFIEKMSSPDQMFLQATHALTIAAGTSLSTQSGFRAIVVAGFVNAAYERGTGSAIRTLTERLGKMVGISNDDMAALFEHINTSGRGITRGTIAEAPLGSAGTGLKSSPLGKVGHVISIPFFTGEDFAAKVSRIAAFIDIRKLHPDLPTDSRQFWDKVQARDSDLSFHMNTAEKSVLRDDAYLAVATQWTSYSINAITTVVMGKTLSKAEKAAFIGSYAAMYGAMGWGVGSVVNSMLPEDTSDNMRTLLTRGPIDYFLDETVGIAMSYRLAPAEGMLDRVTDYFTKSPLESVPALKILADTASDTTEAVLVSIGTLFGTNSSGLMSLSWENVARNIKLVDNLVIARTMALESARVSSSGKRIEANFTTEQVMAQALGFAPTQAYLTNIANTMNYDRFKDKKNAVATLLPILARAQTAAREGDLGASSTLFNDARAIVELYGFNETERAEVLNKALGQAGIDGMDRAIQGLLEQGAVGQATQLMNSQQQQQGNN